MASSSSLIAFLRFCSELSWESCIMRGCSIVYASTFIRVCISGTDEDPCHQRGRHFRKLHRSGLRRYRLITIVILSPKMVVRVRVNQLNSDPTRLLAFSLHYPLKGPSSQFAADVSNVLGLILVLHYRFREITPTPGNFERAEINSSVIPSAKYSSLGSGLMFAKGRTATLFLSS